MASFVVTSLVAAGLLASPPDALQLPVDVAPTTVQQVGGLCDRAVAQALAMTGGELLSANPVRNGRPICRIVVLVINGKGRPKKIVVKLPMEL